MSQNAPQKSAALGELIVPHRQNTDPAAPWYHVMPIGNFRVTVNKAGGERQRVQEVVNPEALQTVMHSYDALRQNPNWPGYLVGAEHESQKPDGSTAAYGWAKELQLRLDASMPAEHRGIYARIEKTPLGEHAIGSIYKFFSTVNNLVQVGPGQMSPVDIVDIGLTNKPAYRTLVPASHRDPGDTTQEDSVMLESIRTVLVAHKVQVAPDADEATLTQAVEDAFKRAETAEHRLTELESAQLERDADTFVAAHKDKFADEAKLKALFKASRKAAEDLVGLLKAPVAGAPARVLHREDGKTPETSAVEASAIEAAEKKANEQREFVDQVMVKHRLNFTAAWARAEKEKPELFKPIVR